MTPRQSFPVPIPTRSPHVPLGGRDSRSRSDNDNNLRRSPFFDSHQDTTLLTPSPSPTPSRSRGRRIQRLPHLGPSSSSSRSPSVTLSPKTPDDFEDGGLDEVMVMVRRGRTPTVRRGGGTLRAVVRLGEDLVDDDDEDGGEGEGALMDPEKSGVFLQSC